MKIIKLHKYSLIIVIFSFLIDQVSKLIVLKNILLFSSGVNIFYGFNLVYVENKGVSFGLLSNFNIPFYLGILSLIISGYISFLIAKTNNKSEIISLSLILGGALGNGYDRLVNGYVIDFIDIYIDKYHWPAFNFADSFITIGAVIFLIQIIKNK
tara:strand:- start:3 stop:467 length:465 start_codon:yes stop_codon:yes gene_type:complete